MRMTRVTSGATSLVVWALFASIASAQQVTIEPDNYADGTELDSISSEVQLSIADDNNVVFSLFHATANTDPFDFAPTGVKVFGHANVPFINDARRLRMDFVALASSVEIQFAGGDNFDDEVGRLRAFDSSDSMIAEIVTSPLCCGATETLRLDRLQADIAWAVAYVAADEGNFGRFDALRFTVGGGVSCPEDLNGDHRVDLADLATLLSNFGTSSGATPEQGDVDNDDDVDLGDLARLLIRFGSNC